MSTATTLLICLPFILLAEQKAEQKSERIMINDMLTAEAVPEGYGLAVNEIKDGDKLLGHRLVFSKEGAGSKVVISVENRKLPDRAHKIAALKGYVNGTTGGLQDAGFKLVKKEIPDVEKVDVNKRITSSFVYNTPAGGDIYLQIQVLFTDVGHNIVVVADNENDYRALTKWAETIEPAKKESKKGK